MSRSKIKKKWLTLFIMGVLVSSVLAAAAVSTENDEPGIGVPYFEVDIDEYDDMVVEGEELQLNYTLTNKGRPDRQDIDLSINGEPEETKRVHVGEDYRLNWTRQYDEKDSGSITSVYYSDGILYIARRYPTGSVSAYHVENDTILWENEDDPGSNVWSIDYSDGVVYSGCSDEKVIAYDAEDGTKIWEHDEHEGTVRDLHYSDGVVYSGAHDDKVIAYDVDLGRKLWMHEEHDDDVRSIHSSEDAVYSGSRDNTVIAYDADGPDEGEGKLWRHSETEGFVLSLHYSDGVVYSGNGSEVIAYDADGPDEGEGKLWRHSEHEKRMSCKIFYNDGVLYSGSFDNSVLAYDADGPDEGEGTLWQYEHDASVRDIHYSDGTVYSGTSDGSGVPEIMAVDDLIGVEDVYEGQFTWSTEEGDAGEYTLNVSSEDDHDEVTVTVKEPPHFDVSAQFDSKIVGGEELTVNYSVENTGGVSDEQDIVLKADENELGRRENLTLEPDESKEGNFTWQTEEDDAGSYQLSVSSDDDSYEDAVTVLQPPFFEVTLNEYDEEVLEGDEFSVDYVVENIGEVEDTQNVIFTVEVEDDGTEVHSETVEDVDLGEGDTHDEVFTWDADEDLGEYYFSIETDDDTGEGTFEVMEPAFFDVSIVEYEEEPVIGEETVVEYEVVNTGGLTETQDITFYVDGNKEAQDEVTLSGGDHAEGSFEWTPEDTGSHYLNVESDEDGSDEVQIVVLEEPFFQVEIIRYDHEVVEEEEFAVYYEIKNTGEAEDTQDIEFYVDGDLIDEEEVTLDGEDDFVGDFEWAAEEPYGSREIKIESEDHSDEVTVTVLQQAFFEVDILSLDYEGDDIVENDEITVEYEVVNTGDIEGSQDVQFYVDEEVVSSEEITLQDDGSEQDTFSWTAQEPYGTRRLMVESEDDSSDERIVVMEDATFELSIIDYDEEIVEGDLFTVEYEALNSGDVEGTQEIEFYFDGELEESEEIDLGSNVEEENEFTVEIEETGVYTFSISSEDDDVEGDVTVLENAYFEVSIDESIIIEVEEGDTVTVNYTVTNTGEVEGTQDLEFQVDGEIKDWDEVTLGADQSREGQFEWTTEEGDSGEYDITVESEDETAEESGALTVESVDDDDDDDGFLSSYWWVILLVVIGAILAGALLFMSSGEKKV